MGVCTHTKCKSWRRRWWWCAKLLEIHRLVQRTHTARVQDPETSLYVLLQAHIKVKTRSYHGGGGGPQPSAETAVVGGRNIHVRARRITRRARGHRRPPGGASSRPQECCSECRACTCVHGTGGERTGTQTTHAHQSATARLQVCLCGGVRRGALLARMQGTHRSRFAMSGRAGEMSVSIAWSDRRPVLSMYAICDRRRATLCTVARTLAAHGVHTIFAPAPSVTDVPSLNFTCGGTCVRHYDHAMHTPHHPHTRAPGRSCC